MRIAVVGAGVSGLSAAWALEEFSNHEVHLFESGEYIGGHTNTVRYNDAVMVDTGFIVFNEVTYPNFLAFLRLLSVDIIASDMSFAVSRTAALPKPTTLPPFARLFPSKTSDGSEKERGAFEWAGASPASLFCQWSNLFSAGHWRMVWDIIRFNYQSLETLRSYQQDVSQGGTLKDESIGKWLDKRGYGDAFKRNYLIPMASSIWSTPPSQAFADFPARTLLQFMHNHHLLQILDRPQWLTLHGGSKSYVDKVLSKLKHDRVHKGPQTGKIIDAIRNEAEKWLLRTADGEIHQFDRVVFATHADTTVKMLKDEWDDEESKKVRTCLKSFRFSQNTATLHCDEKLMPIRRSAWSAWNFLTESIDEKEDSDNVTLTYWMNLLQSLPEEKHGPILVTLNAPPKSAAADKIVSEFAYDHPIYTAKSVAAQETLKTLQGWKGARFAGAWTNYGFHEDGFTSGLRAAADFGAALPFEICSAERALPKASRLTEATLKLIEFVRFTIAPYLGMILAPLFIALSLVAEMLANFIVYLTKGSNVRCAIRNELRAVRASWEKQLPLQWQRQLYEASQEAPQKRKKQH